MKMHKNLYTRYRLLERKIVQFLYIYITRGRCNPVFFQNSSDSNTSACIKWNCTNFLHKIHTIRKKHWYNFCVHTFLGGAAILFFSKVHLIVIARLPLHGITQKFLWNIRTARNDVGIISVIIPH